MLRFGKTRVAEEEFYFYDAKKTIKIWDVYVDNIVILTLIETKNNSKYLTEFLDDVLRPVVLILPQISEYMKTFKDKDREKDKFRNNKLIFLYR